MSLDWSVLVGAGGLLLATYTFFDSRSTKRRADAATAAASTLTNTQAMASTMATKSFDVNMEVLSALRAERSVLIAEIAKCDGRCDELQAQLQAERQLRLELDRELVAVRGTARQLEEQVRTLTSRLSQISRRADLVPDEDDGFQRRSDDV